MICHKLVKYIDDLIKEIKKKSIIKINITNSISLL